MLRSNARTPRFLAWGLVLLIMVSVLVACEAGKTTWGNEHYSIDYDAQMFDVQTDENDILVLNAVNKKGKIKVEVSGFHPFDVSQSVTEYFDNAQVSFEEEFDRITNKSSDDNKQYGISYRTVSISGDHTDFETLTVGMMKLMISDETLLYLKIFGDSKAVNAEYGTILELIESTKISD